MICPHCERLRQQYLLEAEREARAILAQRSSWLGMSLTLDDLKYESLQDLVGQSRRKQAQLSHELQEHELAHHAAA